LCTNRSVCTVTVIILRSSVIVASSSSSAAAAAAVAAQAKDKDKANAKHRTLLRTQHKKSGGRPNETNDLAIKMRST
jgi:F420-dependent methylenetetrahydromethanopterin dehydrogenase